MLYWSTVVQARFYFIFFSTIRTLRWLQKIRNLETPNHFDFFTFSGRPWLSRSIGNPINGFYVGHVINTTIKSGKVLKTTKNRCNRKVVGRCRCLSRRSIMLKHWPPCPAADYKSKAEDTRGRKPAPIFDLKNRRRLSTPKTDMAEKSDDDAVAAAIMHSYSCKSYKIRKKT